MRRSSYAHAVDLDQTGVDLGLNGLEERLRRTV